MVIVSSPLPRKGTGSLVRRDDGEPGMIIVWLDDASRVNALGPPMLAALLTQVRAVEDDPRILVLRSTGEHFCAGTDLSALETLSDADLLARFIDVQLVLEALLRRPALTVALVRGAAVGAGADLAMACDVRWGDPDARFRFPGAGFGLILGQHRLATMIGRPQLDQCLSGRWIDSAEAHEFGLVTDLVSADAWTRALLELAQASLDVHHDLETPRPAAESVDLDVALSALVRSVANGESIRERLMAYATATTPPRQSH